MLLDHLTDPFYPYQTTGLDTMLGRSPVLTVPAVQSDQYFASSHYANPTAGQSPGFLTNPFTPNASIPPTPGSLAGQKRSRGESFAGDDEVERDGSLPTPLEDFDTTLGEQVMYDGNVTENEAGHFGQDGGRKTFQLKHISRPSMSSRKSQRLDNNAVSNTGSDDLAHLVLPSTMREVTTEPLIDEATRVLGISWTRMDSSEVLLINQAAYNKFIQNHYSSLKEVTVWFENSALPGYLVLATNTYTRAKEYYIFSHDLLEARLVTREASELLPRLQLLPAIELAAPAGHLRAETDSATVSQNKVNSVLNEESRGRTQDHVYPPARNDVSADGYRDMLCSAHSMEMD